MEFRQCKESCSMQKFWRTDLLGFNEKISFGRMGKLCLALLISLLEEMLQWRRDHLIQNKTLWNCRPTLPFHFFFFKSFIFFKQFSKIEYNVSLNTPVMTNPLFIGLILVQIWPKKYIYKNLIQNKLKTYNCFG